MQFVNRARTSTIASAFRSTTGATTVIVTGSSVGCGELKVGVYPPCSVAMNSSHSMLAPVLGVIVQVKILKSVCSVGCLWLIMRSSSPYATTVLSSRNTVSFTGWFT